MDELKLRILIVEDIQDDAELVARELLQDGMRFDWRRVEDETGFLRELAEFSPDLILADYTMPSFDAMSALRVLQETGREIPFILVTGSQSEETAAAVVRKEADDYILKSNLMRLPLSVRHTLERWRIKQALRESEERWQFALEGAGDGVWEWNPQTGAVYFSPHWKAMLGYGEEELEATADEWEQRIHPEDREETRGRLNAYIQGRAPAYQSEYRLLCKDGSYKWTLSRGKVIGRDASGNPLRVIGAQSDITERKRAEEALRESEEKFRAIANYTVNWESWFGPDGKYLWVNPAVEGFTGYSAEEILAMPDFISTVIAEEDRDLFIARFHDALRGNKGENFEFRYLQKNGAKHWLSASWQPIFDVKGNFLGARASGRDITDRRQAEEALRTSEASYRLVVENANEAILVAQDGMLKFVNRMASGLTGYSEQELTSRPFPEFIHPDDRSMVVERYLSRLKGDASIPRYAFRLVAGDGSTKWVEIGALLIEWEGRPATLNFLSEITARKQAEKQLTQSHDLLANLARLVPGVVYQYRLYPDGRSAFPYASPGMNDIYEVTPEEVREDATPVFGRLHPDDYDLVSDSIQESARTLQEFYCEFRVILPRQGLRWRWSQAHPERMTDGGTLWHGIISDITERKQAEESLRESEERYRNVSRLSSDFAYSCIDLGGGGYKVDWITDAFFSITGYSEAELKEKKCWLFVSHPEDAKYAKTPLLQLRAGEKDTREYRIMAKDGSVRWVRNEMECVDDPTTPGQKKLFGAVRDITERKRLEQEAAKARADFLFAVSHELKTPLFLMASVQELIESFPAEQRAGRFLEYGEIWNRNLHRLRHLIENLVDSQRSEGMGQKITPVPTNIGETLQQTLKDVEPLARRQRISFRLNLDPLPEIPADPESIQRLIENLLTNAIKFSSPGGEVEISLTLQVEEALFTVRDYGLGIAASEIPLLFQPFQRTSGANRAVIPGTGLGLYTAKLIAEAHGGSISLTSEEGKGTVITVRLPWRKIEE